MIKPSWLLNIIITGVIFTGCKEKYEPVLKAEQKNFLVVEGTLNVSGGTSVRLSRTTELNEASGIRPESGANVIVVGSDGSQAVLFETSTGAYGGDLQLLPSNTYRLHIRTTEGKDYASSMENVKQTPPIDTLTWNLSQKGLQINVSTHDASQTNQYYKWDYVETWEIHSAFEANFKYIEPYVVTRPLDEIRLLFICWTNYASTKILIGSSARLNSDVISQAPLFLIPPGDERLSVRYSMLVRQYAIDENAYNFYQQLKSTTESLGSIFDPLPSDISGNIKCITNPSEKVIGYVSVSSAEEKRLFISRTELPAWGYRANCEVTDVANNPDSFAKYYPQLEPFEAIGAGPAITAYKSTYIECLDCRLRGTNDRPSFW